MTEESETKRDRRAFLAMLPDALSSLARSGLGLEEPTQVPLQQLSPTQLGALYPRIQPALVLHETETTIEAADGLTEPIPLCRATGFNRFALERMNGRMSWTALLETLTRRFQSPPDVTFARLKALVFELVRLGVCTLRDQPVRRR